jgi:hypothetical protein
LLLLKEILLNIIAEVLVLKLLLGYLLVRVDLREKRHVWVGGGD